MSFVIKHYGLLKKNIKICLVKKSGMLFPRMSDEAKYIFSLIKDEG